MPPFGYTFVRCRALYQGLDDSINWVNEHLFSVPGGGMPSPSFVFAIQAIAMGYWNTACVIMPTALTVRMDPEVRVISGETGATLGFQTATEAQPESVGFAPLNFANGVGMKTRWLSDDWAGSHRVTGATHVVPIGALYIAQGLPTELAGVQMDAAGEGLTTQPQSVGSFLGVLSRRRKRLGELPCVVPATGYETGNRLTFLRSRNR